MQLSILLFIFIDMSGSYIVLVGTTDQARAAGKTLRYCGTFGYAPQQRDDTTRVYVANGQFYYDSRPFRCLMHYFSVRAGIMYSDNVETHREIDADTLLTMPQHGWSVRLGDSIVVLVHD